MKLKTSQLPKQKKGVCTENLLGFLILISNKISTVADFTFLNCFSISLFRCLFISLFHCFSISRLFHSQIDSRHTSAKKPPRAKLFSTERGSSSGSHFLSTCSVSARRKRFWLKRGNFWGDRGRVQSQGAGARWDLRGRPDCCSVPFYSRNPWVAFEQ